MGGGRCGFGVCFVSEPYRKAMAFGTDTLFFGFEKMLAVVARLLKTGGLQRTRPRTEKGLDGNNLAFRKIRALGVPQVPFCVKTACFFAKKGKTVFFCELLF